MSLACLTNLEIGAVRGLLSGRSGRPLPGGGPRLITPDFPGGWPAPPGTCEQVPGGWSAPPGTWAQVPGGWSAPPGTCDHPDFLGTFVDDSNSMPDPSPACPSTTIKFGDAIAVLVARASRRVGVSLLRLTRGHCMILIVAQCKFGKFRNVRMLIRRCMTAMAVFYFLICFPRDSTVRVVSVCRLLPLAL